jgi:hypothetical protein
MAAPSQRGAVVACCYALAYVGFAAPYLAAGLGVVSGQAGAFAVLAAIAVVIAAWMAACSLFMPRRDPRTISLDSHQRCTPASPYPGLRQSRWR